MMTRTGVLILLAMLLPTALSDGSPAAVQEAGAEPLQKKVSRVTVPQSVGPAGGRVAVPIQFTGAEGSVTGWLQLTVRFPASKLTFNRVELGGLGVSVGAEATARARQVGNDTVVDVAITTPTTAGTKPGLPDGPVAQMMFTIGKDLKPETVISFAFEGAVAGNGVDAQPVILPSGTGEIIVSNPSVISCFFYMH